MDVICTCCRCSWDEQTGYYHYKGEIAQPCRECRKDTRSIHYLNNREHILDEQRSTYYAQHEAKKAYYRSYRQRQRQQARAQV